jgi:hypothetical protein
MSSVGARVCVLGSWLTAAACVGSQEPPGPPYRAQLIAEDSVDPETGVGRFSIAARTLHHLDSFDELKGPLYQFYRGGVAHIHQGDDGELVEGTFEHGKSPALRYVVEHGVAIPRDYPTLAMLSAAYQFELVFDALASHTGFRAEYLTQRLGRLRVFFEPSIMEADSSSVRVTIKRNAFFDPRGNLFGLARRSHAEDVPFAADPKVIAHEMGHAVFFLAFAGARFEQCDARASSENAQDPFFPGRFDTEYVIRGINEGFADFHSFSITGGPNSLGNLEGHGDERSLTADDYDWEALADPVLGPERCGGAYYCVGTLFARSLYQTLLRVGLDPRRGDDRAAFTREVVSALQGTVRRMKANADLALPTDVVAHCESHDAAIVNDDDGQVAGAFLEAFVAAMPSAARPALCSELGARFGAEGFPEAFRGACGP